jgi:DNA-binding transcriptional regulator YbjK
MDAQTLINIALAAVIGTMGWFARQVWDAVKTLQRDVHAIEVDLPTSYVSKNEFSDTMKRIEVMFQRISDKLDGKVDKE